MEKHFPNAKSMKQFCLFIASWGEEAAECFTLGLILFEFPPDSTLSCRKKLCWALSAHCTPKFTQNCTLDRKLLITSMREVRLENPIMAQKISKMQKVVQLNGIFRFNINSRNLSDQYIYIFDVKVGKYFMFEESFSCMFDMLRFFTFFGSDKHKCGTASFQQGFFFIPACILWITGK